MNFYKHFIGDYGRSTGDLSITEHGAYRLMLDSFYGIGKPLPAEKKALYRLLRAENETDRRAIDKVSLRFWTHLPEDLEEAFELLDLRKEEDRDLYKRIAQGWTVCGLVNARALVEIVKAEAVGDRNRKIAVNREACRRIQADQGGTK
jgi:uncharacterized protein YdaU (DUF1376 family)